MAAPGQTLPSGNATAPSPQHWYALATTAPASQFKNVRRQLRTFKVPHGSMRRRRASTSSSGSSGHIQSPVKRSISVRAARTSDGAKQRGCTYPDNHQPRTTAGVMSKITLRTGGHDHVTTGHHQRQQTVQAASTSSGATAPILVKFNGTLTLSTGSEHGVQCRLRNAGQSDGNVME